MELRMSTQTEIQSPGGCIELNCQDMAGIFYHLQGMSGSCHSIGIVILLGCGGWQGVNRIRIGQGPILKNQGCRGVLGHHHPGIQSTGLRVVNQHGGEPVV